MEKDIEIMREAMTAPPRVFFRLWALLAAMALVAVMATTSGAAEGNTTRVSVSSLGKQANDFSQFPSISADGRFVAFYSYATNLVPNGSGGLLHVYVHDRQRGTTQLVSVGSSGTRASGDSWQPSISSDGRFVAFKSGASNLVANDTNDWSDVFVRDRQTGTTQRVSVDSSGKQVNLPSSSPFISSDGRFVAFHSRASNLVANDTNRRHDVFVHERDTTSPKVSRVVPTEGATGVALKTDVLATFSQRMDKSTLKKSTFKLYKLVKNSDGTTAAKQITNVTVTPSSDGLKATLNPFGTSDGQLAKNARYKVVVSTGALDVFGNRLDQKPSASGYQPKVWYFKTRG